MFSTEEDAQMRSESLSVNVVNAFFAIAGKLDDATKKQFTIPRCGMSDPISKLSRRKRRYLLQGQSWDLSKHPGVSFTCLCLIFLSTVKQYL